MCSPSRHELRRAAPALLGREQRTACGAAASAPASARRRRALAVALVATAQPPAGASATTVRPARARRAAARRSRRASCRRGARSRSPPRPWPARRRRRARRRVDLARERRPAGVAGQGRRQHVVAALQRGQHELPGPPGVGEAVQADQRRAGAAAMRGREAGDHARRVNAPRDLVGLSQLAYRPTGPGSSAGLERPPPKGKAAGSNPARGAAGRLSAEAARRRPRLPRCARLRGTEKRRPSSMAIGRCSSNRSWALSPGMIFSMPSGRWTIPVTSVVRK